jgi:hypothetical protein
MPDAPAPSGSLLTRKLGPAPVYVWGGGLLGVAYIYSKYQASKQAQQTQQTQQYPGAAQVNGVPAQYVIENNLPAYGSPSAPISPPVTAPPATTPPGTGTQPPAGSRFHGGSPPVYTPGQGPSVWPTQLPPGFGTTGPVLPTGISAPNPGIGLYGSTRPATQTYVVHPGDTLQSVAQRTGVPAETIWAYNTTPGNRPADDVNSLRQRGPNVIYPGESLLVPAPR